MPAHRLTFIALNVSDLDRSLVFYRDVLGVPLAAADHDADLRDVWFGGDHAAFSWTDGAFLHFALYPARLPERPVTRAVQLGFHVDDFEAVHERVIVAASPVLMAPREEPWGTTARYADPDGNIVSISRRTA
ncbi:MAG: VOC family protein [Pseudomonadales bacterium]